MTQEPPEIDFAHDDPGDSSGLASVVLIDRREDIAGICGRVDAAPTFAVVIQAPNGNLALSSELGMRRLQRHAQETGKVIAIATTASNLSARARQVGIPVSRRPEHVRWDSAGRRVIRLARRTFVLPPVGAYVQGALLLAVIVAAVVLGLTMAPSATVSIAPPVETLTKAIMITASPDRDSIDFDNLRVPAREVSASQRLTLAVRTTGKAAVDTEYARVSVTITNTTGAEIAVSARSILLGGANGPRFELNEQVKVPAGKSVAASATAARPGPAGNVPAGTISGWQDQRFASLTVTNPEPAVGGASELRPAVDGADLTAIRTLADDLSTSDAVKKVLLEARPHDAVFLRTAETVVNPGEPDTPVGTPADTVFLPVDVKVTALAIGADVLEAIARRVLDPGVGTGEFIPGSVTAIETGARQLDAETNSISTEILVRGDFARGITREALKDLVKGRSPDDARSTLASRYGIQDAKVSVSPGWAPWLPRFGFRIEVYLRPPAPENAGTAGVAATHDAVNSPTATAGQTAPGR
jgi:hypothetical protein